MLNWKLRLSSHAAGYWLFLIKVQLPTLHVASKLYYKWTSHFILLILKITTTLNIFRKQICCTCSLSVLFILYTNFCSPSWNINFQRNILFCDITTKITLCSTITWNYLRSFHTIALKYENNFPSLYEIIFSINEDVLKVPCFNWSCLKLIVSVRFDKLQELWEQNLSIYLWHVISYWRSVETIWWNTIKLTSMNAIISCKFI